MLRGNNRRKTLMTMSEHYALPYNVLAGKDLDHKRRILAR